MNDKDIEKVLRAKKRALRHVIREERIRLNAIEQEKRKQERIYRLEQDVETLNAEAYRLGIPASLV